MKKSKLEFDHTYTADQNHKFLKKLEAEGFLIRPTKTVHPGGSHCRFIGFHPHKGKYFYLEFVHTAGNNKSYKKSGYSFRVGAKLESYFLKISKNKQLKPGFQHRNYEWRANEKDRLPGWNFVTFGRTPKEVEFWITEYEPMKGKPRPKPKKKRSHPNGAKFVTGMEFDLAARDWKFLEGVLQVPLKEKTVLPCGTILILRRAKKTKQLSVAIAVEDLDRLNQKKHKLPLDTFDGKPALRIDNPNPKMWNVKLVQA